MSTPTLLGLSGELRNKIWRYVLVENQPLDVTGRDSLRGKGTHDSPFDLTYERPLHPGLLSVNRQIREECASIYYGENVFHFEVDLVRWRGLNSEVIEQLWFAVIKTESARKIRTFALRGDNIENNVPIHPRGYNVVVQEIAANKFNTVSMRTLARVVAYLQSHGIRLGAITAAPIAAPRCTLVSAHQEAFGQKFEELKRSLVDQSVVASRRSEISPE